MNRWILQDPIDPPIDFIKKIGGNKLISETLIRRGLDSYQKALGFLEPTFYKPSPAEDLPGITGAVDQILSSIHRKEKILVWGDFDVETSSMDIDGNLIGVARKNIRHHLDLRVRTAQATNKFPASFAREYGPLF